ncbi:MAG: hypothetical protein EHM41_19435 [Chloroflexi bacterium]|nr:MAG: hypothetical protein EHM41_19435 [Chloroflexota bacterium]
MERINLSLLNRLWFTEPDSSTLEEAGSLPELAGKAGSIEEMAAAYSNLFLLNVYPYASVFLDPNGEMNGERAMELLKLYRRYDYSPEQLTQAGAPDHAGLVLGFLARLPDEELAPIAFRYTLDWLPALCLSVEREPGAHPFYRSLASTTRLELFHLINRSDFVVPQQKEIYGHDSEPDLDVPLLNENEEISLNHLIHHLLSPALSGIFISRNRLGLWSRQLGVPLAFGERFHLGQSLFEAAGMVDRVTDLQGWILAELDVWEAAYTAWANDCPFFRRITTNWLDRITETRRLVGMKYPEPILIDQEEKG